MKNCHHQCEEEEKANKECSPKECIKNRAASEGSNPTLELPFTPVLLHISRGECEKRGGEGGKVLPTTSMVVVALPLF